MNKIKIKMKLIKVMTLFFLALVQSSYGQINQKSILTVSILESMDLSYAKIIVTDNEKKIEEIQLDKFYYKDLVSNQIKINATIQKYGNEGYQLVSDTRGQVLGVMITTYIFEK
jgi:hypothetical protein